MTRYLFGLLCVVCAPLAAVHPGGTISLTSEFFEEVLKQIGGDPQKNKELWDSMDSHDLAYFNDDLLSRINEAAEKTVKEYVQRMRDFKDFEEEMELRDKR